MNSRQGLGRIELAFSAALKQRTAALMPYFTLGYPTIDESVEIIKAIAPFSDIIELGVPFSDPIADGPTIQNSTQTALEQGTTTAKCLEIVAQLRGSGVATPLLLMGYINPILAYGPSAYVRDSADSGADGFIVPDLPPEESKELYDLAQEIDLGLIQFLAPTSNENRIRRVLDLANGFLYMISLTGVTGANSGVGAGLKDFVINIKKRTSLPLAVGFGIRSAKQAADIGQFADGVIVGSALINAVNQADDKPRAAARMVRELRRSLDSNQSISII